MILAWLFIALAAYRLWTGNGSPLHIAIDIGFAVLAWALLGHEEKEHERELD